MVDETENLPAHYILIAEDNPTNQHLTKMTLQTLGYEVDIVENGLQALAQIQQRAYSLVLMDIHMPEMDGIEATKRIRALGGTFATLPIIAVTASVLPEQQARFVEVGINSIIEKPFSAKHLRYLVSKWIGEQDASQ